MAPAVSTAAAAAAAPPRAADAPPHGKDQSAVDPAQRDRILPKDWRTSGDRAWTTSGDGRGFHLLVADGKSGYTWRTAVTLNEPGIETDQWIGNVCFTGSGRRAVVVYAPKQFTNREEAFQRGGFTAVVDLGGGPEHPARVTKMGFTTSLAYHNPGCGAGETAVLTQNGGMRLGRTRLTVVDTERARTVRQHELPGQVTSAVPVADRIVAAGGAGLVSIDSAGREAPLASTTGPALHVRADGDGGVSYLEAPDDRTAVVRYVKAGARSAQEIARGPLGRIGLSSGAGGKVFLTGTPDRQGKLPRTVTRVAAAAGAELSSEGRMEIQPTAGPAGSASGEPGRMAFTGRLTGSGKTADFRLTPEAAPPVVSDTGADTTASPKAASPQQAAPKEASAADSAASDPVDADRACSVPRNDPRTQVLQPHWKQVEWAANLAVQDALTVPRPANWNQSGLPSWTPQGIVGPLALEGGGRVPAQVLLGILAQESNLWQASPHAMEGMTGNPLVGDFYGLRKESGTADEWAVDWSNADCGYGVAQVTDGMRAGQRDPNYQKAVAVDYATNVAAGLRILKEKWNQTYKAGIRMNNADPSKIENWYAALWAYNSGINPQAVTGNTDGCTPGPPRCVDDEGQWGLGWGNNPANPDYPRDRKMFLMSASDAKTPQLWPYQEKVIGWAAFPIVKYDYRKPDDWVAGYNQAWWQDDFKRGTAIPDPRFFCEKGPDGNQCDYTKPKACLKSNPDEKNAFHCWWHKPATWKPDCEATCGNENLRFPPGYPEPQFALDPSQEAERKMPVEHYRPNCDPFDTDEGGVNAVPPDSLVIDNTADSVNSVRPGCLRSWVNQGSFGFDFAKDATGHFRSKIDLHQIGGGLGGHLWFGHTRTAADEHGEMAITGTWRLNRPLDSWARVLVHLPAHSAHTQQAVYRIDTGDGKPVERIILQRVMEHRWVSLGAFRFSGTPSVSLSNVTRDGDGNEKVAWDAIAFQPLAEKPRNMIVSLGDSFASGEGAATDERKDYYRESNNTGGDVEGVFGDDPDSTYPWRYGNACHRSKYAWSRLATLSDSAVPVGTRADAWDPSLDHQLIACSGARTKHLMPSGPPPGKPAPGQYHEVSQLDRGFLDKNTTLVTLSIGGNDAEFGKVVEACAKSFVDDCQDTPLDAKADPRPLRVTAPELVRDTVVPSVDTVLRAIHERAPNARIVLMGYPRLISDEGKCLRLVVNNGAELKIGISEKETAWLNESADYLDDRLNERVTALAAELGAPIAMADPRTDLQGKGVCGDPESIHGVILGKTEGEDPDKMGPSQQSFHPNRRGTPLFADALNRTLRKLGT
ncbi:GDSL-type esterase/lipase family protein [Streptomyces sp. NPDC056519]|uniref:golvesin C-terminal-like domain-containing protein n=1 Tax=Streptomyces sp. NPDC056519 TaxID=3345849 RepID=UPI0036A495BD